VKVGRGCCAQQEQLDLKVNRSCEALCVLWDAAFVVLVCAATNLHAKCSSVAAQYNTNWLIVVTVDVCD